MISRILFRLSVAWFAIVTCTLVAVIGFAGGHFDGLAYGVLVAPSALGLMLAWVFLPAKR